MAGKSLLLNGVAVSVNHVLGPTTELAFATPTTSRLLTPPAETQHNSFLRLDAVSSTCLDIPCKAFYPLYTRPATAKLRSTPGTDAAAPRLKSVRECWDYIQRTGQVRVFTVRVVGPEIRETEEEKIHWTLRRGDTRRTAHVMIPLS
jgi:hypothetical protein